MVLLINLKTLKSKFCLRGKRKREGWEREREGEREEGDRE